MKDRVLNNVQKLRQGKSVTQEQLAKQLGVTRQTIISIEKGKYIPSLLLALKISDYFNLNLQDIFKYEKAEHDHN